MMVQDDLKYRKDEIRELCQKNILGDAITKCEILCQNYPNDPESWYLLGSLTGMCKTSAAAEPYLRKAISLDPQYVDAYINLGRTLAHCGKLEEAESIVRRAFGLRPQHPTICFLLGTILYQQDKRAEAVDMYLQAIRRDPNNFRAHYMLGLIYQGRHAFLEAEHSYRHALRANPGFFEAQKGLGIVLTLRGEYQDALKSLRAALMASKFKDAELYYWLGRTFSKIGNFVEAKTNYQQSIESGFRNARSFSELGEISILEGDYEEAKKYYLRAIEIVPDSAFLLIKLGEIDDYLGQGVDAERSFQRAEQLAQTDYSVLAILADVYHKKGANQKACQMLEPLIDNGIRNLNLVLTYARASSRLGKTGKAINLLEGLLRDEGQPLSPEGLTYVHFLLGDLYDRQALYEKAFQHYQKANTLENAQYEISQDREYFERLISTFSSDYLKRAPRATTRNEQLIFIVGMPRSGTSLVEQILASHPQVFGGGESTYIVDCTKLLPIRLGTGTPFPDCIGLLTEQTCNELALAYLQRVRRFSKGAKYVIDKTPHNFVYLGLITLLFPNAKIIHCVRNPLDTCLSCYFTNFSHQHLYSYDLKTLGQHYLVYQRLMRHWDGVLDLERMDVVYEELVQYPKKMIDNILSFIGLPWDDRCLHFDKSERVVKTASYEQVRKPLYSTSIGRWRNYRRYLGELRESLKDNSH